MQPTLRPFAATDSAAAHALWQATEGMGLNAADSAANLAEFLDRNPGLSVVAEQDGKLIGTALCGHDGRRRFVARCVAALNPHGLTRCHVVVDAHNEAGRRFWVHLGFRERTELTLSSRDLT